MSIAATQAKSLRVHQSPTAGNPPTALVSAPPQTKEKFEGLKPTFALGFPQGRWVKLGVEAVFTADLTLS
ncbi:MAG: hypothetical protein V7K21_12430 [Nostoc sp.]|uniref:hypothetical protein n=1 Tax=Nostoc sp. TaxID=1180 RepID=UPI002FF7F22E